ncbi:cysteine dioxygenase type 1-like [Rhinichthys klamathensis goyatoka]|uniref:cysteine dioxygenase type 1-like n=1 Tax=Rhinichthys klamathensis goyatoka TaxID=3034132 RepID=UPI0024B613E9|nr:cysteine dioxygenase type 1-like [Rhinichthys klamathensis goyatoka]
MEQTKVIKPETLDDLIKTLYKIFEKESVNLKEEVQGIMEAEIHDHTHADCFMKILQGQITETRFEWPDLKCEAKMEPISERVLLENQYAYIEDSIGLHRMENASDTEDAVSLHLYCPPYQTCHSFDEGTGERHTMDLTFWSKHGKRTPNSLASKVYPCPAVGAAEILLLIIKSAPRES